MTHRWWCKGCSDWHYDRRDTPLWFWEWDMP
jgi:hypothetical protein